LQEGKPSFRKRYTAKKREERGADFRPLFRSIWSGFQVLRRERQTAAAILAIASHGGRGSPCVVWGVVLVFVDGSVVTGAVVIVAFGDTAVPGAAPERVAAAAARAFFAGRYSGSIERDLS
jgi:hypothetical protein